MVNLRELVTPLLIRVSGQSWDDSSMVEQRPLKLRVPGSIPGHLTRMKSANSPRVQRDHGRTC
jgi:hypothetical protein